jgi:hypothetical protein
MTSRRRMLEQLSADELDNLIQWVLRESVADVTPSPHVWERIQERVERLVALRRAWIWEVPGLVSNAATACLSRVDLLLPGFETPPTKRDERVIVGHHPGWVRVLDHHRLVMRLVW